MGVHGKIVRSRSNTSGMVRWLFTTWDMLSEILVFCNPKRNAFRTGQVQSRRPDIGKVPSKASATSRHGSGQSGLY